MTMSRFLKVSCLIVVGGLLCMGLGLFTFRVALLEMLMADQLGKHGLPLQSVAIPELSAQALRIQDLVAGKQNELRVQQLNVTWDMPGLLLGQPPVIEVSGAHGVFDWNPQQASPDRIPSPFSGTRGSVVLPVLPVVVVKDAQIRLRLPAGETTISITGGIEQRQGGSQIVRLDAVAAGVLGQGASQIRANWDRQGNIEGKIQLTQGRLDLPGIRVASITGETAFKLSAMTIQQLRTQFVLEGMQARLPALAGSVFNKASNERLGMTIERILLSGDIEGKPMKGSFDARLDNGRLDAGALAVQHLSVHFPLQVTLNGRDWYIGLREAAQIKLEQTKQPVFPIRLQTPLAFTIPRADVNLSRSAQGVELTHDVVVQPARFDLSVQAAESVSVVVQGLPGKLALTGKLDAQQRYQGKYQLTDWSFVLPQWHVRLQPVSATLSWGDSEEDRWLDLNPVRVEHTLPEPQFSPLTVSASMRHQPDAAEKSYVLDLTGKLPGLDVLKITGQVSPDGEQGVVKAAIGPIRFVPQGVQPGQLFPVLKELEHVSGLVGAHASIKWSDRRIRDSQGEMTVQQLSLTHPAVSLRDANMSLTLQNWLSLRSPPQQLITIHELDFGMPIRNVLMAYQLETDKSTRIALDKAQFSVMEGTVSVKPVVIDPLAPRSEVVVHINAIDLATFFEMIQVEGLTGTGHVSGDIPITLERDQVTIRNGQLAATAPGTLRFKSDKAVQMLADAGEEVNLLMQALQDFQYSELTLRLDKSATHDLTAQLSILGHNAAIRDGQPFRLNIKLESNIDKILRAISQGYDLSSRVLHGSFSLH